MIQRRLLTPLMIGFGLILSQNFSLLYAAEKSEADTDEQQACLVDESAVQDVRTARMKNDARARELGVKEAELKSREQAIDEQFKKLTKAREELQEAQLIKTEQAEKKIAQLTETVLTMSAKAASKMLSTIDEKLAVDVMSRMDSLKLAKIMNTMDTAHSSRLSELMTGVTPSHPSNRVIGESKTEMKGGSAANGSNKPAVDNKSSGT